MQQIPPTVVQKAAEFRMQPPAHGNLAKPRVNRETTTTQMKSDFRYKGQARSMEGFMYVGNIEKCMSEPTLAQTGNKHFRKPQATIRKRHSD